MALSRSGIISFAAKTSPLKHPAAKRFFDVVFSLLVLILGAPLYLAIMLIIYFSAPGPAFYAHTRIGKNRKLFKCWKFRTMRLDADKKLKDLLANNARLQKEWHTYYKLKDDPRVLPLGKYLRKTSLDELPQFFNVLKGDLSVVGPRPCVPEEIVENFGAKTDKILSIRPGITGIWQISGRNHLSRQQRIALEEKYIEKQSLLGDLQIIVKTIPSMLFAKGAY